MTKLEARLHFNTQVSEHDLAVFKNFMRNENEDINALNRLGNPLWALAFKNYEIVYSTFFDCLAEEYEKEEFKKAVKKYPRKKIESQQAKIRCQEYIKEIEEEAPEESKAIQAVIGLFRCRFIT